MGIDQGTSGTRAMIVGNDCEVVGSAYCAIQQNYPNPGWVEQNPLEIWNSTLQVIKESLSNAGLEFKQLAGIGIANQRETTTFWNKYTGEPLGNSIGWQDRRSLSIVEKMKSDARKNIVEKAGRVLLANISASKIESLLDYDLEIKNGVMKNELIYGTIDTWLLWKLSGGKVHISDYSNTSVTTLLNATSLEYEKIVLNMLNIPIGILPELRNSSEIYGYTDSEIFGASVPIAGIAGDQQAAVLGQACIKEGMAKNTYGTGSFMIINTGNNHVRPGEGVFSPILWKIKEDVCYGLEGMSDISGASMQWLRKEIGINKNNAEFENMAKSLQNNGGVYFIPAFVGLGSPYFDSYARGSITGLNSLTTKEHVVRAALESMAFQVKDSLDIMETVWGKKIKVLRVDGGGADNDFLMQFQADILGIPVERPVNIETSCMGAVYLAGLAVGIWGSKEELAESWSLDKRFEPQISMDERLELCHGWRKALKKSLNWL